MRKKIILLIILTIILALLHLHSGSQNIEWSEIWNSLFKYDPENMHHYIIREVRIPRLVAATIAGAGLSLSGLLMQNTFNNPLADPSILGVNAGASLSVALGILSGATIFQTELGVIGMALFGALIFALFMIGIAKYVKNNLSLLLIGIMIGSVTGAIITLLQSWADAQRLRQFTLWTMGSLQNIQLSQLPYFISIFVIGAIACFFLIRNMNAYVLGEKQALYLGVNTRRTRNLTVSISAIIAGLITGYCGPIAFIGMAIPNVTRLMLKTQNHKYLIPVTLLVGASFLLAADLIILHAASLFGIPLNALTALLCAPFILFVILKKMT